MEEEAAIERLCRALSEEFFMMSDFQRQGEVTKKKGNERHILKATRRLQNRRQGKRKEKSNGEASVPAPSIDIGKE